MLGADVDREYDAVKPVPVVDASDENSTVTDE